MNCRACNSTNTRVTCTEQAGDVANRWCRCLDCKSKFKTIERYAVAKPIPLDPHVLRGDKNPNAKLNAIQVQTVRHLHQQGYSNGQIALRLKMHRSTICKIVNYKTYKNIK